MEKKIKLERPIVFFDIETTGTNIWNDRIVEISLLKVNVDYTEESLSYLVNPGVDIEIPDEAIAIHGITKEQIANKPCFREYSQEILKFFNGCDIGGYNAIKFDIPLLQKEFERCGFTFDLRGKCVVDPMTIFFTREPRNLEAAYKKFCNNKTLENPHQSLSDVTAAKNVFFGQLEHYSDLGETIDDIHLLCNPEKPKNWIDHNGKLLNTKKGVMLGFGKYQSKLLSEVALIDPSYFDWMLSSDFDEVVKIIIGDSKNKYIQKIN